eukprot:PITA_19928
MLSNAGLQKELWTEAVATTCYVINRSPSTAIGCKIPQEVSDIDHQEVPTDGSQPTEEAPETSLRRSTRIKRPPRRYDDYVTSVAFTANDDEPLCYQEEIEGSKSDRWKAAMKVEMVALGKNGTWDLVELPKDRKTVGCKWVFKLKRGVNDTEDRYKTRLVAKGFSQKPGIDFHEIFSPVVKIVSIRIVLALVVLLDLELQQLDVKTAFLHGDLDKEIYMEQPEGFVEHRNEKFVCRLQNSLYGLKQSPRQWYMANPGKEYWSVVKWVLRYLRGTSSYCITYNKCIEFVCGYVDSDFAGDLDKRRSTSGYVFTLAGGAISSMSKLQNIVALPTTEAEYIVASHACKEAIWLKGLSGEFGRLQDNIKLFCDNQSAIHLAKNPAYHSKSKHIPIKYHFVREVITERGVSLEKVHTKENCADMFTKLVLLEKLRWCLASVGLQKR